MIILLKVKSNKPVPKCYEGFVDNISEDDNLFFIVGDLHLDQQYGESLLVIGKSSLRAYDDNDQFLIEYADIEEAFVKRMYGSAYFSVKLKNGHKQKLMRFTYAVASICEAAAEFVNAVNEKGYEDDLLHSIDNAFSSMRSFCPKCGRKLSSPDADCLNCKGKGKMFSKFAKYASPHKKNLLICMLLSVFTTAASLVPPYITGHMVDKVLPSGDKKRLIQMIIVLLAVFIVQYTITAFRSYLLRVTGNKIVVGIKKDIYAKAQYLPMSFYDKTSTGSVINRINSDSTTIQNFVMKVSQEAVVHFFTMIGILAIMFYLNPKMTVFSLVPIPIVAFVGKKFGNLIGPLYLRLWRRVASISGILTDSMPGIRVIKAFSGEKDAVKRFDSYCDEWLKEDSRVAKITSAFPAFITFLVTCGTLIIWGVGGNYVINGEAGITTGLLVSFVSYASMFYNPVNFFANFPDTYRNTLASAEKLLDIIDAEPEHDFGKGNVPQRMYGKIEFKNVSFSFDRSKKVLSNINLTIEPGDIVGIVGTTGSGKSTLINLIMRYYDDYDGEILIDGVNIKDLDMAFCRDQIGFVQQEPLMFKDTIFNNIAYGSKNPQVEQIFRAADIANAHNFIARLPDGYDTLLGERGVGLSGGEKQRISIARAVMKNPSVLILDEATAAVDSETEKLIQEAIERLISGRTTLMIAHRLSTLRKANKIVVVDKGEIIECGHPDDLLAQKGKYYKLVQIQSMGEQLQAQKEAENFE